MARAGASAASACSPPGSRYCDPAATQAACDRVLVVCADINCYDVRTSLQSTGAFATVDNFEAMYGTPAAALLAGYHAAFVWTGWPYADPVLLGDRLAAFHDQGGGVVICSPTTVDGRRVKGAYGSPANGYALFDYAQGQESVLSDSLGDILEPLSPLMSGVTSLAAKNAFRVSSPPIAGRAVVVARWRGGGKEPLVLRGTRGNRTLVEINMFPMSSRANSDLWTGNGAELLRNALKYSRCILPSACKQGLFSNSTGEARREGTVVVTLWSSLG